MIFRSVRRKIIILSIVCLIAGSGSTAAGSGNESPQATGPSRGVVEIIQDRVLKSFQGSPLRLPVAHGLTDAPEPAPENPADTPEAPRNILKEAFKKLVATPPEKKKKASNKDKTSTKKAGTKATKETEKKDSGILKSTLGKIIKTSRKKEASKASGDGSAGEEEAKGDGLLKSTLKKIVKPSGKQETPEPAGNSKEQDEREQGLIKATFNKLIQPTKEEASPSGGPPPSAAPEAETGQEESPGILRAAIDKIIGSSGNGETPPGPAAVPEKVTQPVAAVPQAIEPGPRDRNEDSGLLQTTIGKIVRPETGVEENSASPRVALSVESPAEPETPAQEPEESGNVLKDAFKKLVSP